MNNDTPSHCRQHDQCPSVDALYEKIVGVAEGDEIIYWTGIFSITCEGLLTRGWAGHADDIERAYRLEHMAMRQLVQRRRALMKGALPFAPQTHCRAGHPMADALIRRDGKRECRECKKARDDTRRNRCASGGNTHTSGAEGLGLDTGARVAG